MYCGTYHILCIISQCMKWPVAHLPNSTWFWLELVGNCCERLKIIMKYTNTNFVSDLVMAGSFIHWYRVSYRGLSISFPPYRQLNAQFYHRSCHEQSSELVVQSSLQTFHISGRPCQNNCSNFNLASEWKSVWLKFPRNVCESSPQMTIPYQVYNIIGVTWHPDT